MALELKGCTSQLCDGFEYIDTTKLYSLTNLGGYGPENGIEDPSEFDTYTLSLWSPQADPATDEPTFELDLLANVPVIDDDEDYVWTYSLESLGVTSLKSGWWYFRTLATKDGDSYEVNAYALFTQDLRNLLAPFLKDVDPDKVCAKGCSDPLRLKALLDIVDPCNHCACANVCDMDKTTKIIDYLYSKLPGCPGCC